MATSAHNASVTDPLDRLAALAHDNMVPRHILSRELSHALGKIILVDRMQRGMSQSAYARALGVDDQTGLSRREHGRLYVGMNELIAMGRLRVSEDFHIPAAEILREAASEVLTQHKNDRYF